MNCLWIDDFYGSHHYGVQFGTSEMFDPEATKIETRDSAEERAFIAARDAQDKLNEPMEEALLDAQDQAKEQTHE